MTQVDKAIEYLKKAIEVEDVVCPEEMLLEVFGIKRELVSKYSVISVKEEIKVGDKVKVVGPSLSGRMDMVGKISEITGVRIKDGLKEFYTPKYRIFPESSVELV